LPGCALFSDAPHYRGIAVTQHDLDELTPGTASQADAQALLGPPTFEEQFNSNNWVYVSQTTKMRIGKTEGVKAQHVVVLNFDNNGILRSISQKNQQNGVTVAMDQAQTPVPGGHAGFLQQLIGGVGSYNPLGGLTGAGAGAGGTELIAELGGIGSLRGPHNAQNAACAAAAALALGLTPAAIQAGLRSFPGLAHRMEQVGRLGRVLFVNDSKATNADSAAQALACFHDIFWIAGGKPKTGGIESLRGFFPRIRKAYLIGEAGGEFAGTLRGDVPHDIAGTLDKAVTAAARDAAGSASGEPVVLLSPACASFDQYRNFEVRGDAFRELVRALPGLK
jgi:UDP-N-acetylmuramoylalanine--D-glutamate ligase